MSATALTLFDAFPTKGGARKADKATARGAADAKNPGPDMLRVFDALVAAGGTGTIDDVAARIIDRDRGPLFKRLSDLDELGWIRDTGRTVKGSRGRKVTVWEVVER